MGDDPPNHRDEAILALAAERFDRAGDLYSLAAYGGLTGVEGKRRAAFDPDSAGWAGFPLAHLLRAGVCYRVAGTESRARNRAGQAILVAGDQRDHVVDDPVDRAACNELVGVARVVAGDEEKASAAFDRAASGYAEAAPDAPAQATTRPLLQAGTDLTTQLSRPDDVEWDDIHGSNPAEALARRVQFLRSRLPSMLAARVETGKLHPPRGSTEYNTGRFRCPACGSDDVNYVADTVLCLRCGGETDRV
jgi:hypothetical protein